MMGRFDGKVAMITGGTWLARPIAGHSVGTDIHAGRHHEDVSV